MPIYLNDPVHTPAARLAERENINALMAAFLATGGSVDHVETRIGDPVSPRETRKAKAARLGRKRGILASAQARRVA